MSAVVKRSAVLISSLTLAACASTPHTAPAPESWATYWQADANAAPLAAQAWQVFADPVLDALIARTAARNLDLRIASAEVRAARAQRAAAGAALAPQLDLDIDASQRRIRSDDGTRATSEAASLSAVVSWEVDLFGRLRNARAASAAELEASLADREAVRLLQLSEVTRNYIEWQLYRQQQQLAERTAAAQEATLRITRARYREGVSSRLDLERATSQLAVTRAELPQARERAEAARQRLALLTASTPAEIDTLLAGGENLQLPDSEFAAVLQSPTEVLAHRPDVRAADQRLRAASASLRATQALRYPRLSLSALLGVESSDIDQLLDDHTRVRSLSAGLLTPLFDFGRIRAAIDVADARQERALLDYERSVRAALAEVQTTLVQYTQGKQRQHELAEAAEAARRAAALARQQYGAGVLSMFEVLDAERSLLQAELSWSQATAEVSLRLVTLYQSLGLGPLTQG